MGGPISQGPLAGYGINLAPMALSWAFRFAHTRLEGFVGIALKSAQKRQKKEQRAKETLEERAARKSARHAAKEAAQQQPSQKMQEPDVRPLTADEIREAAALAAERRRAVIESNTPLDDLDWISQLHSVLPRVLTECYAFQEFVTQGVTSAWSRYLHASSYAIRLRFNRAICWNGIRYDDALGA